MPLHISLSNESRYLIFRPLISWSAPAIEHNWLKFDQLTSQSAVPRLAGPACARHYAPAKVRTSSAIPRSTNDTYRPQPRALGGDPLFLGLGLQADPLLWMIDHGSRSCHSPTDAGSLAA